MTARREPLGGVVGGKRPPDAAASDTFEYRHDER
jgi:hypothetical protein